MEGLKIREDLQEEKLHIIRPNTGDEVAYFGIRDLSIFFKWLKAYEAPLNYVSVPMRESYCEMIYILKPQTLIVMEPEVVYHTLDRLFGTDAYACMEETAATFYNADTESMSWDMPNFLQLFYSSRTRKEALNIYNQWQEVIPLNDSSLCKVLTIFEYHIDEILNYFSLKEVIAKEAN